MAEEKVWKPLELVKVTAEYLAGKDVPSPRPDAELLLCETLGLARRVDLYAGFEREISGKELAAYRELIRRRAAREPVSRILGRREFMGIAFTVTPDVLSPRPETELLVETAIAIVRPRKEPAAEPVAAQEAAPEAEAADQELMPEALEQLLDSYGEDVDDADAVEETPSMAPFTPSRSAARPGRNAPGRGTPAAADSEPAPRVLDLGTGSGCIAISVAAHLPAARVTAVDASPKALAVAKRNAAAAGVAERVEFRQGDWFSGCREGMLFDLVLSNPPYLVEGDAEIWPEVSGYDPALALYAGRDGLDCYRRIIPAAADWVAPGGWVLFEVGAGQAERVASMLRGRGFEDVGAVRDYGGVERVVKGRLRPD